MGAYAMRYPYYMGQDDQMIDPETGLPLQEGTTPYPYAPPPAYQPPAASELPAITTANPEQAAQQDRIWSYGRGAQLERGFAEDEETGRRALGGYTEQANAVYDPLTYGRGGLTADQERNIVRGDELGALGMTQEEIDQSYLNPYEQEQILGQPNSRRKWFDPHRENQIFAETEDFRRGAVRDYGQGLRDAFHPEALDTSPEFYDALGATASDYGSRARAALDPRGLTVSPDFLNEYRMTPQEKQDIVTSAANVVGTRDKAAIAEAERRARAAGTNPLGVAALRARSERGMSAGAADAATAARVAASEAAANRLRTGEDMRLRYGQNLAGMRADVERGISDAGYRAAMGGEGVRSGIARDIADRRTFAADRSGQARIGSETDLARERLGLQQNITRVGNEAERDVDNAYTQRMRDIALNRQGTGQYVQGQRYGRGLSASDRLSDRYRYGAETGRADAQEGRNWLRSQVDQANQNTQRGMDRRLQLYGTQGGLGQGATRTQGQLYEAEQNRPKWWEKLIGGATGAASAYFGGGRADGGIITEPTYAMLGEAGPEMIVPMNPQATAQVPPSVAMRMRMGRPRPFATAPPPARPQAAYSQQYRYAQ